MGRLWDRMNGTRYPDSSVSPLPAKEVRAALLGRVRPINRVDHRRIQMAMAATVTVPR